MNLAHQVKRNAQEYQAFVQDLGQWTAAAPTTPIPLNNNKVFDLAAPPPPTHPRIPSTDYYRRWDQFDVVREALWKRRHSLRRE